MTISSRSTLAKAGLTSIVLFALLYFLVRTLGRLPTLSEWKAFLDRDAISAAFIFGLLFILATGLRAVRFGVLVRRITSIPWAAIVAAFLRLFMLGAITPFRLGEGLRAVWIRNYAKRSSEALGYWLGERWSDLVALIVLTLVGFAMAPGDGAPAMLLWIVVVASTVGYLLLWLLGQRLADFAARVPVLPRALSAFGYMREYETHLLIVALTVLIWLSMALGFWLAIRLVMDSSAPFGLALLCLGAVNLAGLVSAAPANLGSFQAAMVGATSLYGYPSEKGFMTSVLIQTVGITITLILGLAAECVAHLREEPTEHRKSEERQGE